HRLVGVAHTREVDIPNRVGGVEPHQDVAISDDEAPGHGTTLTIWVPVRLGLAYNRGNPVSANNGAQRLGKQFNRVQAAYTHRGFATTAENGRRPPSLGRPRAARAVVNAACR